MIAQGPPVHDGETVTSAGSSHMLPPDTMLAERYRIVEVAGAGGMGIVYRARDLVLDIDVAVKLIDAARLAGEVASERFRRELVLARQVTHPNVLRIHDLCRDGDLVFITMDYRPAKTLAERLSAGPLAPAAAIEVARQLAGALAATHEAGVVHRDVKPANVLLSDDGGAWLCDFGIARSLEHAALTRAGDLVGTLYYLAPEQVRGEPVDGRADLYALGLTLWEMLTGEVPGRSGTRDEALAQRASGAWPVALEDRRIPPWLRRVLRRCLAPGPADRYPDARSLLADLERGRSGIPLERALARAAAAAAVLALAVAAWTWWPDAWPAGEPRAAPSIAVLPVVNLSGDPALDWVRRGLPELVAAMLSESTGLRVVDNVRVARTLDDLHLDPQRLDEGELEDLAATFGVSHVLSGRLIGGGGSLRLQLELTAPASDRSATLDAAVDASTVLAGAERLTGSLLGELDVPPGPSPALVPASSHPEALAAFDRAVAQMAASGHGQAIAELERAVALDEGFVLAWLRLADAYRAAGHAREALDAAERALALLGDAQGRAASWARARRSELRGHPEEAAAAFGQIVAGDPEDTDARLALGELLIDLGQLDRARAALDVATRDDPQNPRAWFLLGKAAIIAGDAQAARDEYLVRALVLQNRLANPEGRGEVLNALGIAHEQLGQLDRAGDYYRQAVTLRTAAGDRRGVSASLSNLARLQMIAGEHGAARGALERALAVRRDIGDLQGVASLLNELGVLEEEVGNYAAALGRYRESLRLYENLGGGRGVAEAYTNIAFTYLVLGQYDSAQVFAERAESAHRRTGNDEWLMSTLLVKGDLELVRGDWTAAQAAFVEGMDLARKLENPFGRAVAHGGIGMLAWYQGRPAAALDAFGEARAILEPIGDTRGLVEYRLRSAEMLLDLGLHEAARVHLEAADTLLADSGSLAQNARLALASGCADAAAGNLESAAASIARAGELARATGSPALELRSAMGRVRCLGGDLAAARGLVDSATDLGHRPHLLASLALLAEYQLDRGLPAAAEATLTSALRPPLALDSWIGNWRLHALLAHAAAAHEGEVAMAASAAGEARALATSVADGLSPELRASFLARLSLE